MAINLGAAYVDIVPSTAGLGLKIRKEVEGPLEEAGRSGGRKLGENFTSGLGGFARQVTAPLTSALSSAFSSAGRTAMQALETTAAASGAFLATSLVSGYNRLTTIQDATAALTISLGDATAAASVLDDVLGVVRGTPFNLDQFAASAQRLVGFGIEAAKIPEYLTAIGEAAATQGRNANDFADRLATVFGQVAASGQVSLADVWRISDTGVNALAILANHFGVATDEMKTMISQGAVPATEALDALASGILQGTDGPAGATVALEGTMASLRDTLTGAAGGFRAATARLGESILSPFSGVLTTAFTSLSGLLDAIGEHVGEWADGIVQSGAVDRVAAWFEQLPDVFDQVKASAEKLGPALVPLGAAIAALSLGGLSSALGPFGAIIPTINPVVAALGAWIVTNDDLRASAENLVGALGDAFREIAEAARPIIDSIAPHLEGAFKGFIDWLAETAVPAISGFVSSGLEALSNWWDEHGDNVKNGLSEMWRVFSENIWPVLREIGKFIGDHIIPPLSEFVNILVDNEGTWTAAAYGIAALAGALVVAALAAHPVLALVAAIALLVGVTDFLAKKYNDELVDAVQWVLDGFARLILWGGIVKYTLEQIAEAARDAWEALSKLNPNNWVTIGGSGDFGLNFDNRRRPEFDDGGVMPGRRGVHSLAWVAGGETILPTHKFDLNAIMPAGRSEPLIGELTVVQQPGEDPVERAFRELRKREYLL